MYTNQINSCNFQSLFIGSSVLQHASHHGKNSPYAKEVKSLMKMLQENNIHRKENVDVILQRNQEGFFGAITCKKHGMPVNVNNTHPISKEPNILENFKNWVDTWNQKFSN